MGGGAHDRPAVLKYQSRFGFAQLAPAFDDDAAELMAERERPWQRLRPVPFQDVQIGAADAAGADLDQCGLLADLRPRHGADDRLRARSVIGANPNFLHAIFSRA
jgi:hypothetical protein